MSGKAARKKGILTFGGALMYGLCIFGVQMMIGMLNSYQAQFYTSVLNADLTVCAVIILVAKVISSLSDPVIGSVIDRSRFKSGKMRPWIAISAFPFAVMTLVMFVNIRFPNDTVKYVYITLTSVLWNITMSFADIPSQGLLALLSPNSEERSVAAGISNTMKSIAIAAPTVIVPVVCVLTGSDVITAKEYLLTALFVCVLSLALILLSFKCSREVIASAPSESSFKAMFTELKNNRMLLLTFLVYILGFARNMAMNIQIQASAVLMRDIDLTIGSFHLALAGENLSVLLGIGSGVVSMISIVIAPVIHNKLGTRKTYFIFGLYGLIVNSVAWALYVYVGGVFRSVPALIIMNGIAAFMFGTHGFTPMIMLSDTVDYTEMTTGKRNEGIQYAVFSMSIKLANAFCVALGVFIVGLSGYVGTMKSGDITDSMRTIVLAAFWLIPGISAFLSCIPVWFFKIDGKVKEQVQEFMAAKELKK